MKNTRRDFVKRSTMASAGLVFTPSLESKGMFNIFNEKKLKVALVGCGGRGSGAANQALQADENIELVAMADAFEDRLTESYNNLYEKYKDTGKFSVKEKNKFVGFDGYKKAIDLADVVILATPPGFRPTHFAYAVENGKHVFMEKPVATDVPGIQKVLRYAREAKDKNLKVRVALQRRYQENYLAALEEIKKGAVGKLVGGQVYWNSAGVWVRPRLPEYTELNIKCATGTTLIGSVGIIFWSSTFTISMWPTGFWMNFPFRHRVWEEDRYVRAGTMGRFLTITS